MLNKRIKRDIHGRRTDRVKPSEIKAMVRLQTEGLTPNAIAKELKRKPETVKLHLSKEQTRAGKIEAIKEPLNVGAEVIGIKTPGYYDKLFDGYPKGYKEVTIEIVLHPLQPTTIDILNLVIFGKPIESQIWEDDYHTKLKKFTPVTITSTQIYNLIFQVPKKLAKDTKDAKIYTFANLKETYSDPFYLSFKKDF